MKSALLKFLAVPIMAVALMGVGLPTNSLPDPLAELIDEHAGVTQADAATTKCLSGSTWFGCSKWKYSYSPRETEIILGGATAVGGGYVAGARAAAYAAGAFGLGVWRAGHCLYVHYLRFYFPVWAGFYRC